MVTSLRPVLITKSLHPAPSTGASSSKYTRAQLHLATQLSNISHRHIISPKFRVFQFGLTGGGSVVFLEAGPTPPNFPPAMSER